MTEQTHKPHTINTTVNRTHTPEWQSDSLIEKPDAEWSIVTGFPMSVDDLWAGPKGITRIGPANEGYAGYMLPEGLHRFFKNSKFSYLLPPSTDGQVTEPPKQLEVGSTITDGDGGEELTVVKLNNEAKYMTFEANWNSKKDGKPGLHYTWDIHALPTDDPNSSQLATRMRIAGVSHPGLLRSAGPLADRLTMHLVRKGMTGENLITESSRRRLGKAATLGAGILAAAVVKRGIGR